MAEQAAEKKFNDTWQEIYVDVVLIKILWMPLAR
jgi:hypothetical protein